MSRMKIELRDVDLPSFGVPIDKPQVSPGEYEARCRAAYNRGEAEWLIVYGDREHYANIAFLSSFDPRFEEALLILGPGDQRYLVVGNEGESYAALAALTTDVVLCQSFSLMGQQRDKAPRLGDVLREIGITGGSDVAVVGWKYLEDFETDGEVDVAFLPVFIVDVLRRLTGRSPTDVTRVLMHPANGLRAFNSSTQIACLEWAASRASAAVLRVVRGAVPGISEFQAVGSMGYVGEPLSAHVMFASGKDDIVGLRSPTPRLIERDDGATTAIGYWGGLSCRAGIMTDERDQGFFEAVVAPYFTAIATWYANLRIGGTGAMMYEAIMDSLGSASFKPMVNPGHLISLDEWIHSPIRPSSRDVISSSMAFQCDIIPAPLPRGWVLNCEDGVVLANESLRDELADNYPDVWDRIQQRQGFMREQLGIQMGAEVLPLSSTPAYLAPFWLATSKVCTVSGE